MPDIDAALQANRAALDQFITTADATEAVWTTARAPGKWSPSQVAEHLARTAEAAAQMVAGEKSVFPRFPFFLRSLFRVLFFNKVISRQSFSNAKTFGSLDPETGPASPAEARQRLETAMAEFEKQCRARAATSADVFSPVFGTVSLADYVMFMALHTTHHRGQLPGG